MRVWLWRNKIIADIYGTSNLSRWNRCKYFRPIILSKWVGEVIKIRHNNKDGMVTNYSEYILWNWFQTVMAWGAVAIQQQLSTFSGHLEQSNSVQFTLRINEQSNYAIRSLLVTIPYTCFVILCPVPLARHGLTEFQWDYHGLNILLMGNRINVTGMELIRQLLF